MGCLLPQLKVLEGSKVIASESLILEIGDALRILPGRREVYRGRLPSGEIEVVAKCFLPHPKQARDWRREWEGLLQLQSAGLPAPAPLAVCEDAAGSVYVVMEYLSGAVTLGEFTTGAGRAELRECMAHLATLIDALHQAGARQTDQHIDNWAVTAGQLYLLDAGTYRFESGPLPDADRISDLAAICATLPPHAETLFRKSLTSYGREAGIYASGEVEVALRAAIPKVQQARVRRYYKKSQRACTEFGQHTAGAWRGMFGKGAHADLVATFFEDPDALMDHGERIKSGNTCTVQKLRFEGRSYVLKRYNQKAWLTRLRRALGESRARKSWSNSWILNMSFIPTASCVAFAEESGFPLRRSFLLMEEVDAMLLPEYVAQYRGDALRLSALVEAVGCIWDQLARIAAVHGDLKATNWMVDAAGGVSLIDLDSFRFGLSASVFKLGREKDMKRFLENWKSAPELAEAFRMRLEAHCPR
ncbi:lipopolysaccharide kinase InaA family protein [Coraliomargarita sp. W4R53]